MSSGVSPRHEEILRLDLDLGSYELSANECEELIELMRQRTALPDGEAAWTGGQRLEALLGNRAGTFGDASEEELDAIADAAWEWLRSVGPDSCPERVVIMLDTLRARRARE